MTTAAISIIDALDDRELFAPWFEGKSWTAWRAILKAAFCIPLDAVELEAFRTVAEREPPNSRVKELWIGASRRAGKDSIASGVAAYIAAFFEPSGRLRPGERALVLMLATDRDQAKICLNYVRSFFSDVPMLKAMIKRETANGFELVNDVDIAIGTNNFRAVRGRPILAAILDEVAFYQSESSASPDVETFRALKPGTATLAESIVIGINSPYKKSGLLYQKYREHFGRPGDDVLFIKAASTTLNPTLDQRVIDQALIEDPQAARSEWLGEFRDDIAGYVDVALIEAAIDYGVTARPPSPNRNFFSFCDPSGGARDSFTAAIAHDEDGVAVLDCLVEIRAPFNPSSATKDITDVLKQYGLTSTVGDKYGAAWVTSAFSQHGIHYEHSERDRSAIYSDCLPLFTSGRAKLIDNKKLVSQFGSLERRTSSIGKDKIDHGPGGHDDLCNAAAGALVLAASRPSTLIISPEFAAQFEALTRNQRPRGLYG